MKIFHKQAIEDLTFHPQRRTCAPVLLLKNLNPKVVQEMQKHATISQKMDSYSNVPPDMQDETVLALEGALS